jgi:hypothetical protein
MAFTSNTAQTQILLDTSTQLLAKFMYYTADGTNESDVLKVNVETLSCRTFELTIANTANAAFQPGDLVTGVTSNNTGYVSEWRSTTNTLVITETSGAFTNAEVLTLNRTNKLVPTTGTVVTPTRQIEINSIWHSVTGGAMSIELGFNGVHANTTAYVHPVMMLSDSSYFGKNALPAQITNPALNPTGNFSISTYKTEAHTTLSYTVIVQFRKTQGFAQRPIY